MKLQNKETGQEGNFIINKDHFECVDLDYVPEYRTLAELNEDWEDYEEPKEHWIINSISGIETTDRDETDEPGRAMIEIGNYFNTREEAEKAVRKLKAWKRLKDVGCRFILDDDFVVRFVGPESKKIVSAEECTMLCDDYRMLFGGE